MSEASTIRFHSSTVFSGLTGTIDLQNCIIHGVALITGDVVAEGHDLHVDNETLTQLHALGSAKGKVPVNLDHGSGIMNTCGYIDGFRLDGNKLRGDWHLLKSHDETPKMLERAQTMPDCFGLSVAFKGKGVVVAKGKKAARAEKLLSVDCVTRPAANEGLFSVKETNSVDNLKFNMADNQSQQEPSLSDIMNVLTQLNSRIDAQEQQQAQIIDHLNTQGSQEPEQEDGLSREDLEQLHAASDEQLAELGLTRDEVSAAVSEYNESISGEQSQDQGDDQAGYQDSYAGQEGAAGGEMAGAAGGGGEGSAAFRALTREVIQLKSKIRATEVRNQAEGEEMQFAEIESKMAILATQRDKAIELAEALVSENEALNLAVRTGTRPVRPGVDNGVRLFNANDNGELHSFQVRVKELKASGKTEGEAISFASKENPGLHADWVQTQRR